MHCQFVELSGPATFWYQMIEDLVSDNGYHLEALSGGYAVHKHIAVQADELYTSIIMYRHDQTCSNLHALN